jgi:ankyrin repeat protein
MAAPQESSVKNMIDAASRGDLDLLKAFVLDDLIDMQVPESSLSLSMLQHTSSNRCFTASLHFLLNLCSDTAAKERSGKTALHAACEKGHEEIVKWLLERGANTKCYDARRRTPVVICFENNNVPLAKVVSSKQLT